MARHEHESGMNGFHPDDAERGTYDRKDWETIAEGSAHTDQSEAPIVPNGKVDVIPAPSQVNFERGPYTSGDRDLFMGREAIDRNAEMVSAGTAPARSDLDFERGIYAIEGPAMVPGAAYDIGKYNFKWTSKHRRSQ